MTAAYAVMRAYLAGRSMASLAAEYEVKSESISKPLPKGRMKLRQRRDESRACSEQGPLRTPPAQGSQLYTNDRRSTTREARSTSDEHIHRHGSRRTRRPSDRD